jgi:anti-sigma B factor antagonist
MPLAVTSRIISDVVVVEMSGRLCFLESGLLDCVKKLLEEGRREFVLNLADVPYVDSFGLGQLISVWTSIQSKGGQLILLRPRTYVQKLFQITKLNEVFQVSSEEAEAIKRVRVSLPASA